MSDRIETERLVLRRASWDDLPAMHRVLSDPRATVYWSTPPHGSLEQTREWMSAMVGPQDRDCDDFIVERDGECIGKIGAYELPEFGFILHPDTWGKGYASEALAAYLGHRRRVAPDMTLTTDVDPRNEASLALLRKHGFVETGRATGTWEVAGELCDSVYLARKP